MIVYIAPIVEGHAEQRCVERLLHRIWKELLHRPERLQVLEPFRASRDALVHRNGVELTQTVEKVFVKLQAKARRDTESRSLLLLLLDAEGECPAQLAPRLLAAATAGRTDAVLACVLAKRMLENWIVAGAATLAGVNGLPHPLQLPNDPEDRNGAAWLEEQLRSRNQKRSYKKTTDAALFVQKMDLEQCRNLSPSFDKLCRELARFLPPAPVES